MLLFTIPSLGFSQEADEELIDWKDHKQLTWADYKGKPDPNSDAAASTTTYLGIEYNISPKGFKFKIQCRFSRNRSWGLAKTDYILKHEQGHFDIAEIFARKLNKEMSEYEFDDKTFKKDLRNIYEKITKEKEDFQNQYDKETDHSRRAVRQAEWLVKINEMLDDLKDYSSY
jgi:hypothetical protein